MNSMLAWRRRLIPVLLWTIFASGLLVQAFAPRLEIENDAFVIPPSLISEGKAVDPAQIIARERRLQALSAVLTLGGALGLAYYYRRVLFRPSRPDATASGEAGRSGPPGSLRHSKTASRKGGDSPVD